MWAVSRVSFLVRLKVLLLTCFLFPCPLAVSFKLFPAPLLPRFPKLLPSPVLRVITPLHPLPLRPPLRCVRLLIFPMSFCSSPFCIPAFTCMAFTSVWAVRREGGCGGGRESSLRSSIWGPADKLRGTWGGEERMRRRNAVGPANGRPGWSWNESKPRPRIRLRRREGNLREVRQKHRHCSQIALIYIFVLHFLFFFVIVVLCVFFRENLTGLGGDSSDLLHLDVIGQLIGECAVDFWLGFKKDPQLLLPDPTTDKQKLGLFSFTWIYIKHIMFISLSLSKHPALSRQKGVPVVYTPFENPNKLLEKVEGRIDLVRSSQQYSKPVWKHLQLLTS